MVESGNFASNDNKLSYVYTGSERNTSGTGVIFVHAADGNRLGPHRMFVEFAQRLSHAGIASMRFDMRGCGDSTGIISRDSIEPDIEDLVYGVRCFVARYDIKKLFLFGISRGARVSFACLSQYDLPIDGAILLSAPSPNITAGVKSASYRLKEYFEKCKSPESLKKLIKGKIHFKQIVQTLTFAFNTGRRYRYKEHQNFATKCPLLFIYGQKDPITTDARVFYSDRCQKFEIPHSIIEIENANHSFFHYKWKELIFEHAEKWFVDNLK